LEHIPKFPRSSALDFKQELHLTGKRSAAKVAAKDLKFIG